MLSADGGIASPASPVLATLPVCFALPLALALSLPLSGSETPCLGWDSISCNQVHLFVRACTLLRRDAELSAAGSAQTQSKQVSQHPVRQLAVFHMNEGQERDHKFSQFSCVRSTAGPEMQEEQRCILSLDLSFIPRFWLHFDEVTVLCVITCTVSEPEGDEDLQLNLCTRILRNYRRAKTSAAASVIINKISNAFI